MENNEYNIIKNLNFFKCNNFILNPFDYNWLAFFAWIVSDEEKSVDRILYDFNLMKRKENDENEGQE